MKSPNRFPVPLAAAFVALGLFACAHVSNIPAEREVSLTFLQTTDFHGAIETTAKDRDSGRPIGGAAFLSALLEREEATNPEGTLVLDAGDIYQGSAISNLSQGRVSIEYMNLADFDAAAVGNHEFDFGIDTMEARMDQARFPMLCANVIERATGAPPSWSHPYEIFTRLGVRIAVIGLITPDTPKVTLPENVTHLDFLDPAPIANRIIAELIPAKADLVIILCHIGCTQERGGPLVGELVDMAEAIEGENVILGGHTHRIITGKVGETVVVESGSLGRWVGRVDLRFDRISRTVVDASTRILTVFADSLGEGSVPPDPDVVEMVAEYREEIAPILDEHVGDAAVELEAERAECPMGNWIADVIREASGSDIALQNPGGVRSPINAGPILYADVYRVMPFDNTIVVARMTGTEVKSYLETIAERKSFLHASGIRYTLDYSKQEGERVTQVVLSDGSALDPAHEYRVAVNNFMAQGGDDLPILQDLPTTTETSILVRDAMISACRAARDAGQALSPKVEGRVTRIPA